MTCAKRVPPFVSEAVQLLSEPKSRLKKPPGPAAVRRDLSPRGWHIRSAMRCLWLEPQKMGQGLGSRDSATEKVSPVRLTVMAHLTLSCCSDPRDRHRCGP